MLKPGTKRSAGMPKNTLIIITNGQKQVRRQWQKQIARNTLKQQGKNAIASHSHVQDLGVMQKKLITR